MARFDVYRLKAASTLVVVVQTNVLDHLGTRVVVPLLSLAEFSKAVTRVNPQFNVDGIPYVFVTHMIGTISMKEVGKIVGNLSHHRDEIVAATDFLFQGF